MPALRLEGVANAILGPLSFSVAEGESVALLGPSGSGKSTLLKIIAGLLPHQGRVYFDERDMSRVPAHRRGLGYMSQDPLLFPHLRIDTSLRLVLLFDRASAGQRGARTAETLHLCAIDHRADRRPATLSGGERQRAALARALVRRPRLLLLDEPFAALDPPTRRRLWDEVDALRRRLGMTLVLVTHSPEEAARLADRTMHLVNGHLV
ncbi:ABC transporter ATP-binding protein [Pararhodospirillum photometricum]|uniref:Spermidine/putrescine ABC transporter ATP-binding subunit n=1 Tax=Pararhodospirillum photometricum DSM 122 TaxID=1150469 RepID=H6SKJ7_PARPM|nr:ATP-binding cassette domain-containing protein [Pararhodospirillum photometricum]CCG08512.1 Spermidine/putrescine ABC transporter ATP-binding subunit [Pararhodospirillum photometricum DSM 122]